MFFPLRCLWLLVVAGCLLTACKLPAPSSGKADQRDTTATLFPMRPFALRQIGLLAGQPYTLRRTTVLNGQRDTAIVGLADMPWGALLRDFLAADIDRARLLDQYRFSQFPDAATSTVQYFYEALNPKLPTRLLTVATDKETKQIVSLYAETASGNFWGRREQKLYYAPLKVIQVQEQATSRLGPDKTSLVEYRFQRNRDDDEDTEL